MQSSFRDPLVQSFDLGWPIFLSIAANNEVLHSATIAAFGSALPFGNKSLNCCPVRWKSYFMQVFAPDI